VCVCVCVCVCFDQKTRLLSFATSLAWSARDKKHITMNEATRGSVQDVR